MPNVRSFVHILRFNPVGPTPQLSLHAVYTFRVPQGGYLVQGDYFGLSDWGIPEKGRAYFLCNWRQNTGQFFSEPFATPWPVSAKLTSFSLYLSILPFNYL